MVTLDKVKNPDMRMQLEEAFTKFMGTGPISGNAFYVHSDGSAGASGKNINSPISSIDAAVGNTTINNGDVIFVLPGHVETLAAATGMVLDKAGVTIIGLGTGNDRPKITLGTLATTTIVLSAASVAFKNIIVIGALDGLNSAVTITGDYCDVDIEYRDTSATVESNIGITATSVDHGKIKLKYVGFTAGNAVTNAVVLDGCTATKVDIDFYGNSSSAVVEFTGNACTNIFVSGYFYNESSSSLSLNCDDTITGSTWFCVGYDGKDGYSFAGGSGSALAGIDTSAISAAISTIDAFHDVPAQDSADNVVMSDVIGNKTDTTGGDSAYALLLQILANEGSPAGADMSTDIAAVKTVVDAIATYTDTEVASILAAVNTEVADILTDTGTTIPAILAVPTADVADNSVISDVVGNKNDTVGGTSAIALIKQVLAALVIVDAFHDVTAAADSAANSQMRDVVGRKDDTVAGDSIVALLKQVIADTTVIGTIVNAGGTATLGALLGDFANTSAVTRFGNIQTEVDKIGTIVNAGGTATIGGCFGDFANTDLVTRLGDIQTEADKIETPSAACNRQAGKTQIFTKNITAAANAGVTTVGTITTQSCMIKRIVLKANGVTTADLTSAAIEGGASQVVEFISAATAVTASINADDEQVSFSGAVVLDATKTITIDLQGTGATAVDLDVIVEYCACTAGGYIA
jgi:hypothetical protein